MRPVEPTAETGEVIHKLFAANVHTVPVEELLANVERARRDAQLRYVAIYGVGVPLCRKSGKYSLGSDGSDSAP
jgi:hypothetical protein